MSIQNDIILTKSLIIQLLAKQEVLDRIQPQKIEILRDFLEDKSSVAEAIKVMEEIEAEFKAD